MGWTVYIKDNNEGQELLKILTREPNGTFTNIVESFEKASMFTKDSFMKRGKKVVRGKEKILRSLMQEARSVRKPIVRQPKQDFSDDYNNMMHDIMFDKGDDEDDDVEQTIKTRQKEEIDKKANHMQEIRSKSRPPAKVPKEEKIDTEIYGNSDMQAQAEDEMNDYLNAMIKRDGDD